MKIVSLSYKFFLLIFFLSFHSLKSCMKTIRSFGDVDFNSLNKLDDSLFVFDVDETLITPDDEYVRYNLKTQGEKFRKKWPEEDWKKLRSLIFRQAKCHLIDKNIINTINNIKKKHCVIACTALCTGVLEENLRREEFRCKQLKDLGFEGSFSDEVYPVNVSETNRNPWFYKGVLAADSVGKGKVIGAFLDKKNLHPKRIIMFDDCEDFLKSVKGECDKRAITFYGYIYKGGPAIQWNDEALYTFQINHLIKTKKWLDDTTARANFKEQKIEFNHNHEKL